MAYYDPTNSWSFIYNTRDGLLYEFRAEEKDNVFKIDIFLRYPLRTCNCKAAAAAASAIVVVVAIAAYDDDVVDNRIVQIMNTVAKILGNLILPALKKYCNLITAEDWIAWNKQQ